MRFQKRAFPVKVVKKNKTTKSIAELALKKVMKVENNFERKYNTNSYNGTVSNTLASLINLTAITQNDTGAGRDGDSITIKSILIDMLAYGSGNTDDINLVRVIVVRDLQQVASTAPAVGSILETPGLFTSPYALETNRDRFKILLDKVIDINPTSITYNGATTLVFNPARHLKKYLFPNCKVAFNGTTATSVQKNGLWLYAMSVGSGVTNVSITTQTTYTDN